MADKIINESQLVGLPPIEDKECQILIQGTMLGVESLKQQAYYANSRNLFWKLLTIMTGNAVPENYGDKKAYLIKNKIALWDMCHTSCPASNPCYKLYIN